MDTPSGLHHTQFKLDLSTQFVFPGYDLVGMHSCENKLIYYNSNEFQLLIFEPDKQYFVRKINLAKLNPTVHGVVFYDRNTLIWLHSSFEYANRMSSTIHGLGPVDEMLFILTHSGPYKFYFKNNDCNFLIDGPYKHFQAVVLEIVNAETLVMGSLTGELLFYNQNKRLISRIISDFHSERILNISKFLKSIDSLPLIYTLSESGTLCCWNLGELQSPLIKFEKVHTTVG